jgi:glycine betaine/proline transport system permease protein
VLLAVVLAGRDRLALGPTELTALHRRLTELSDAFEATRAGHNAVIGALDAVRSGIDALVTGLQRLIAQPSDGRPVPQLGWLGVVAVSGFLAGALGNLRVAALTVVGLLVLGLQGLWTPAMDTFALTVAAVLPATLIGVPAGIVMGLSPRARRVLTPVLDVAQILPALVYLLPLTLLFLIGPASAVITTLIYALPPVIRLTAHGVRTVPVETVEAARSLGAGRWQRLTDVLLPLSRRTVTLGVNQTTMAALSMVTIAALIDAPGLGRLVLKALESLDVGAAFNAGLGIVVLAVVLDRTTTAAATRTERRRRRSRRQVRLRHAALAAGALVTGWLVWLSHTYLWAADFPTRLGPGGRGVRLRLGDLVATAASVAAGAVTEHASGLTTSIKDGATRLVIDPLQAVLAGGPWWLSALGLLALAALLAGRRVALGTGVCLAALVATGLCADAMVTLASTVVATVLVMAVGLPCGVWMGRDQRADRVLRPLLDAGQTMPAFVYLVPFAALFGASRFTAILAAVVYAAPSTVKIVADGVRAAPAAAVEAAVAFGSGRRQVITKVQLPMARRAIALALNQGLINVLAMVVVGALVGAGALGYDVVAGFSQGQLYGKGLAAGAAVVVLGIMLDRISQAAARRAGSVPRPRVDQGGSP